MNSTSTEAHPILLYSRFCLRFLRTAMAIPTIRHTAVVKPTDKPAMAPFDILESSLSLTTWFSVNAFIKVSISFGAEVSVVHVDSSGVLPFISESTSWTQFSELWDIMKWAGSLIPSAGTSENGGIWTVGNFKPESRPVRTQYWISQSFSIVAKWLLNPLGHTVLNLPSTRGFPCWQL